MDMTRNRTIDHVPSCYYKYVSQRVLRALRHQVMATKKRKLDDKEASGAMASNEATTTVKIFDPRRNADGSLK